MYCSGFCVDSVSECPITSILKVSASDKLIAGFEQFYTTNDGL